MEANKMLDKTACAYKEIYEILKIFPRELVNKIPQEKIRFFYNNMDTSYEFNISKETFDGQTMLEKTKAILAILFRDYWANDEQRSQIVKKQKDFMNFLDHQKKSSEDVENFFQEQSRKSQDEIKKSKQEITIYQESVFAKMINKILNFFKGK